MNLSDSDDPDSFRVRRDTTTLRERTAAALRNAIFNMHFRPAQRLVERDLCELTGVSRSSVREALRELEAEGLVMRTPGKGMHVTALSPDDAREIYEIRGILEAATGRYFAERAEPGDARELKSAYARLKSTRKAESSAEYVEALDGVYDVLWRGARNRIARQFIQTLNGRIRFLRALTSNVETMKRRQETITLMGGIVDAACARKADETAGLCHAFVERSAAFADGLLRNHEIAGDLPADGKP